MAAYLLGIDVGNSVCKAVLFTSSGEQIQAASQPIPTLYPSPGRTELDPEALWQTVASTVRKTVETAGVRRGEIAGLGVCGHGNGLYLLDRRGKPLKGIQSMDLRAAELCGSWKKARLSEKVYPYTLQEFWPAQTNSLLAWLKTYEPETYRRAGAVLLCKDFVNYRLTGRICSDYTDMSATNLMDVPRQCYSDDLLELYGLGEIKRALPALVRSTDKIGEITAPAAQATGLPEGTPVFGGMLDVDAGMIGSGVIEEGLLSVVAGTWSINSMVRKHPVPASGLAMTAVFARPERWLVIEASATSVSNLQWFINELCIPEQQLAVKKGKSVYEICDEQVSGRLEKSAGIVFQPFLFGSASNPEARAGFRGVSAWHTRADLLCAVYKGIVFGHCQHIGRITGGGAVFDTIRMTGGGARSPVLAQMLADALRSRVEIPRTAETGALGAALAAATGLGIYPELTDAVHEAVSVARVHLPSPARFDLYHSEYEVYLEMHYS